MSKTININLLKENPKLFFSQLPEKAEEEISEFLYFIICKYNLSRELSDNKIRFKNFIENPIQVKNYKKFTKEELHER